MRQSAADIADAADYLVKRLREQRNLIPAAPEDKRDMDTAAMLIQLAVLMLRDVQHRKDDRRN